MKKEFKIIIGGLCVIILSSIIVFWGLYYFMDRQTNKDVRNIAEVFLQETAEQKENRFEALKTMRFDMLDSLKSEIRNQDTEAT